MSKLPQHLPGNHAAAQLSTVGDDWKAQLQLVGARRRASNDAIEMEALVKHPTKRSRDGARAVA